jgi:hypothetical protein
VCVLEKNTREFVRELREVEEEKALQAAAPTIGIRASRSEAAMVAADSVRDGDRGARRRDACSVMLLSAGCSAMLLGGDIGVMLPQEKGGVMPL